MVSIGIWIWWHRTSRILLMLKFEKVSEECEQRRDPGERIRRIAFDSGGFWIAVAVYGAGRYNNPSATTKGKWFLIKSRYTVGPDKRSLSNEVRPWKYVQIRLRLQFALYMRPGRASSSESIRTRMRWGSLLWRDVFTEQSGENSKLKSSIFKCFLVKLLNFQTIHRKLQ